MDAISTEQIAGLVADLGDAARQAASRRAWADTVADQMRSAGLADVRLDDVESGRSNVVGVLRGQGPAAPRLLVSDLDGGWRGDGAETGTAADGTLSGGADTAALTGLATQLATVATLRAGDVAPPGAVTLVAATGQREGGTGLRSFLQRDLEGGAPAAAVVCAPTGLRVENAHAGVTQFLITLKGRAVWVGQISLMPWVNAIDKVLTAVHHVSAAELRVAAAGADFPELPQLTATAIRGGLTEDYNVWRPAVVADYASVLCDLRFPPGGTADELLDQVRAQLEELKTRDEEFNYELAGVPVTRREPWRGLAVTSPPLAAQHAKAAAESLAEAHEAASGQSPAVGRQPGLAGGMAGHVADAGIPCVTYGPGQPTGSVEVSQLQVASSVLANWCVPA